MSITQQQLLQITPNARPVAGVFVPVLNTAMGKYQIITPARMAAFLAQVGHESSQLTGLVENLNYSAEALCRIWPSRFDEALATECGHKPEKIANIAYESRMGNGALVSGDGWTYRGRGLIQVTGKANYQKCGQALALDLIASPELLEQPPHAAMSAGWFWSVDGLNALADVGGLLAITRRINGGLYGYADRLAIYQRALTILV